MSVWLQWAFVGAFTPLGQELHIWQRCPPHWLYLLTSPKSNIPWCWCLPLCQKAQREGEKEARPRRVLIEKIYLTRIYNKKKTGVLLSKVFFSPALAPQVPFFKHLIYESKAAATALFCKNYSIYSSAAP